MFVIRNFRCRFGVKVNPHVTINRIIADRMWQALSTKGITIIIFDPILYMGTYPMLLLV